MLLPSPPACTQFLSAGFPLIAEYEWAAAEQRHDMGRGDLVCASRDNMTAIVVELKMLHKVSDD